MLFSCVSIVRAERPGTVGWARQGKARQGKKRQEKASYDTFGRDVSDVKFGLQPVKSACGYRPIGEASTIKKKS